MSISKDARSANGGEVTPVSVVVTTVTPSNSSLLHNADRGQSSSLGVAGALGGGSAGETLQQYICCGLVFSSSRHYQLHLAGEATKDPAHAKKLKAMGFLRCSLCSVFVQQSGMSIHLKKAHGVIQVNKASKVIPSVSTEVSSVSNLANTTLKSGNNYVIKVSGQALAGGQSFVVNSSAGKSSILEKSKANIAVAKISPKLAPAPTNFYPNISLKGNTNTGLGGKVIVRHSIPASSGVPVVTYGSRIIMKANPKTVEAKNDLSLANKSSVRKILPAGSKVLQTISSSGKVIKGINTLQIAGSGTIRKADNNQIVRLATPPNPKKEKPLKNIDKKGSGKTFKVLSNSFSGTVNHFSKDSLAVIPSTLPDDFLSSDSETEEGINKSTSAGSRVDFKIVDHQISLKEKTPKSKTKVVDIPIPVRENTPKSKTKVVEVKKVTPLKNEGEKWSGLNTSKDSDDVFEEFAMSLEKMKREKEMEIKKQDVPPAKTPKGKGLGAKKSQSTGKPKATLVVKTPCANSEPEMTGTPKSNKKRRKQVLKPVLEPEQSDLNMETPLTSKVKVKKKGKNTVVASELATPKVNRKTSPSLTVNPKKSSKKLKENKCDNLKNTPKTTRGRGGRGGRGGRAVAKQQRPRVGRPPRRDKTRVDTPDLTALDDLFEENDLEDEENDPSLIGKREEEEDENVPTVELELFTLSCLNERVSVLLTDTRNPDLKVYASMDAIFVGDSALGDVTNQIGYVTDSNSVVFVSPKHFLFPNIQDIDKFVPSPILTVKEKSLSPKKSCKGTADSRLTSSNIKENRYIYSKMSPKESICLKKSPEKDKTEVNKPVLKDKHSPENSKNGKVKRQSTCLSGEGGDDNESVPLALNNDDSVSVENENGEIDGSKLKKKVKDSPKSNSVKSKNVKGLTIAQDRRMTNCDITKKELKVIISPLKLEYQNLVDELNESIKKSPSKHRVAITFSESDNAKVLRKNGVKLKSDSVSPLDNSDISKEDEGTTAEETSSRSRTRTRSADNAPSTKDSKIDTLCDEKKSASCNNYLSKRKGRLKSESDLHRTKLDTEEGRISATFGKLSSDSSNINSQSQTSVDCKGVNIDSGNDDCQSRTSGDCKADKSETKPVPSLQSTVKENLPVEGLVENSVISKSPASVSPLNMTRRRPIRERRPSSKWLESLAFDKHFKKGNSPKLRTERSASDSTDQSSLEKKNNITDQSSLEKKNNIDCMAEKDSLSLDVKPLSTESKALALDTKDKTRRRTMELKLENLKYVHNGSRQGGVSEKSQSETDATSQSEMDTTSRSEMDATSQICGSEGNEIALEKNTSEMTTPAVVGSNNTGGVSSSSTSSHYNENVKVMNAEWNVDNLEDSENRQTSDTVIPQIKLKRKRKVNGKTEISLESLSPIDTEEKELSKVDPSTHRKKKKISKDGELKSSDSGMDEEPKGEMLDKDALVCDKEGNNDTGQEADFTSNDISGERKSDENDQFVGSAIKFSDCSDDDELKQTISDEKEEASLSSTSRKKTRKSSLSKKRLKKDEDGIDSDSTSVINAMVEKKLDTSDILEEVVAKVSRDDNPENQIGVMEDEESEAHTKTSSDLTSTQVLSKVSSESAEVVNEGLLDENTQSFVDDLDLHSRVIRIDKEISITVKQEEQAKIFDYINEDDFSDKSSSLDSFPELSPKNIVLSIKNEQSKKEKKRKRELVRKMKKSRKKNSAKSADLKKGSCSVPEKEESVKYTTEVTDKLKEMDSQSNNSATDDGLKEESADFVGESLSVLEKQESATLSTEVNERLRGEVSQSENSVSDDSMKEREEQVPSSDSLLVGLDVDHEKQTRGKKTDEKTEKTSNIDEMGTNDVLSNDDDLIMTDGNCSRSVEKEPCEGQLITNDSDIVVEEIGLSTCESKTLLDDAREIEEVVGSPCESDFVTNDSDSLNGTDVIETDHAKRQEETPCQSDIVKIDDEQDGEVVVKVNDLETGVMVNKDKVVMPEESSSDNNALIDSSCESQIGTKIDGMQSSVLSCGSEVGLKLDDGHGTEALEKVHPIRETKTSLESHSKGDSETSCNTELEFKVKKSKSENKMLLNDKCDNEELMTNDHNEIRSLEAPQNDSKTVRSDEEVSKEDRELSNNGDSVNKVHSSELDVSENGCDEQSDDFSVQISKPADSTVEVENAKVDVKEKSVLLDSSVTKSPEINISDEDFSESVASRKCIKNVKKSPIKILKNNSPRSAGTPSPSKDFSELSPTREWHGRGAKLKAQVLIQDQQTGVMDSHIISPEHGVKKDVEGVEPLENSNRIKNEKVKLPVSLDKISPLKVEMKSPESTALKSPKSNSGFKSSASKSPRSPRLGQEDREWQARGAKLKAQIMISDQQSGQMHTRVDLPENRVSPILRSPPAKRIKLDRSPLQMKDIRSFFVVQKSPEHMCEPQKIEGITPLPSSSDDENHQRTDFPSLLSESGRNVQSTDVTPLPCNSDGNDSGDFVPKDIDTTVSLAADSDATVSVTDSSDSTLAVTEGSDIPASVADGDITVAVAKGSDTTVMGSSDTKEAVTEDNDTMEATEGSDTNVAVTEGSDSTISVTEGSDTHVDVTDSGNTTEALTEGSGATVAVTETIGATVSITEGIDTSVAVTESIDTSVALTESIDTSVSVTESIDTSISVTESIDASVSVTESIDTSVAVAESIDTSVSVTESIDTTVAGTESIDTSVAVTESIDTSVSVTESIDTSVAVTESIKTSVSVPESIDTSVSVPESIDTSVSVPESIDTSVAVTESIDTSVSVTKSIDTSVAVTESIDTSVAIPEDSDTTVSEEGNYTTVAVTETSGTIVAKTETSGTTVALTEGIDATVPVTEGSDTTVAVTKDRDTIYDITEGSGTSLAVTEDTDASVAVTEGIDSTETVTEGTDSTVATTNDSDTITAVTEGSNTAATTTSIDNDSVMAILEGSDTAEAEDSPKFEQNQENVRSVSISDKSVNRVTSCKPENRKNSRISDAVVASSGKTSISNYFSSKEQPNKVRSNITGNVDAKSTGEGNSSRKSSSINSNQASMKPVTPTASSSKQLTSPQYGKNSKPVTPTASTSKQLTSPQYGKNSKHVTPTASSSKQLTSPQYGKNSNKIVSPLNSKKRKLKLYSVTSSDIRTFFAPIASMKRQCKESPSTDSACSVKHEVVETGSSELPKTVDKPDAQPLKDSSQSSPVRVSKARKKELKASVILDFEGFSRSSRQSSLRANTLGRVVSLLESKKWYGLGSFPLPVDQLYEWDDEMLESKIFD